MLHSRKAKIGIKPWTNTLLELNLQDFIPRKEGGGGDEKLKKNKDQRKEKKKRGKGGKRV